MKYRCPLCGEIWEDEYLDSIADIGCPSCRRCFDLTDFEPIEDDSDEFDSEINFKDKLT